MTRRHGPGRVRRALAAKLQADLSAMAGRQVRVDPERLFPAAGYWKHHAADVCRWEGSIDIHTPHHGGRWRRVSISSYDTMTECLRGFEITDGALHGFANIEIGATAPQEDRR